MMIPTRSKARLPRHLSYPIGAEAISQALAGVPHFDQFSLIFSECACWPASEFQRILVERSPYRILEFQHTPETKPGISGSNRMIEAGWYEEARVLRVFPVLPELRQSANALLRQQGLPTIAQWLSASDRPGWTERSHRIELIFSPSDATLAVQETHGV